MKKLPSHSGTTVVELVLYMGLLSIFILILFDLFAQILSTQTRSTSVSLVQTNGNFLLTKLTRDINRADSVVIPAVIDTTASSMTLKIGTTNATYSVSEGRLSLSDASGTYFLNDVDTSISGFVVKKIGNSTGRPGLQLFFTVSSNVVDNSSLKTKSFQTFAALR